uniref:Disease resistance RPP13-like protein 1 n=1 Tax=Nicotiana tabacum TaxID=4097 RepID=A0A1S4D8L9_TOBAC|nr:PREDICTED: putative disease resistance RPP13-like protein 1 [Nicotiana tabacum]XP_016509552.1 PREDICTED: putative disease resistance RPP13-like protein 1 [Nicotiana tabacum]XP_016509553.1 PREDICTED: putative disease resistance RPP13-like protein 1 [Nicotiana tabacum]XP_016509554.1 PREDICTED: putative disease resistance RPP13-like protein 1 [Nicotiana tabacum]XP_016509555.1 PREDICTED: putative disease resistance RPP13-like protein 1 [Nicotiana tabacum]XP_016509556.1 PREDICTED: putative disea
MRGKEHIEKLSLEWSGDIADNSQNEGDILDELQPNTNIKEVEIIGYRGTNFPNWLVDHSFLKLVKFSLTDCKDCYSLPALGQLPSLKFLTIRGMHLISEVTEEFYSSLSCKKPFNSLETLEFSKMLEWKWWHVLRNGEFSTLQYLRIEDCPKLIGRLPENLCSLTTLKILKCPKLNLETPIQLSGLKEFEVVGSPKAGVLFDHAEMFTSLLQGMKHIVKLNIIECYSLTSLPISSLPSTLKEIKIYQNQKLKLELSVSEMISSRSNMFLERLTLAGCYSIDDIPAELVPSAHILRIERCYRLIRILIPIGIEILEINRYENLEILSVACGNQTTSLHDLHNSKSQKLK